MPRRDRGTPFLDGSVGYAGPGSEFSFGLSASPEIMKAAAEQMLADRKAFAASVMAEQPGRRAPDVRIARAPLHEMRFSSHTARPATRTKPVIRIARGPNFTG